MLAARLTFGVEPPSATFVRPSQRHRRCKHRNIDNNCKALLKLSLVPHRAIRFERQSRPRRTDFRGPDRPGADNSSVVGRLRIRTPQIF